MYSKHGGIDHAQQSKLPSRWSARVLRKDHNGDAKEDDSIHSLLKLNRHRSHLLVWGDSTHRETNEECAIINWDK